MNKKVFNSLLGIVFFTGIIIGYKSGDKEVSEKKKELMKSIKENKELKEELKELEA